MVGIKSVIRITGAFWTGRWWMVYRPPNSSIGHLFRAFGKRWATQWNRRLRWLFTRSV